jgi:hypothetical protein
MNLSPIVLFVYNRPWHTRQTIKALQKNELADRSNLFIYSDGPKDERTKKTIQKIRKYIHTIDGFKTVTIREREKNMGLAGSIIDGVTDVVNKYGRVIVLEDDLITSPFFLSYLNKALAFYEDYPGVFSISAYNHPAELMPFPADYEFDVYCNLRNSSWGWATWINRWQRADWQVSDFDNFIACKNKKRSFNLGGEDMVEMLSSQMKGEIDSWAIRWSYAHFKHNAISICPVFSYVHNIGHDGSGEHCNESDRYNINLMKAVKCPQFINTIFVDERIMASFRNVYRKKRLPARVLNFIVKILRRKAWPF